MTRFPDWQARLAVFLAINSARSFQYGQWDCYLFAANAIQTMTGVDIAANDRRLYTDRGTAYRILRERYGKSSLRPLTEDAAKRHGMQQAPISYARRGDLVLIPRARDYSLGIVSLTGKEICVLQARDLMTIPLSRGFLAWHV